MVSIHRFVSRSSTTEHVPVVLGVHLIFTKTHLNYADSNNSSFRLFLFGKACFGIEKVKSSHLAEKETDFWKDFSI